MDLKSAQDPWGLAQLIDLAIRYIGIRPHSLHISLQTEQDVPFRRLEDPEYLYCLLILGGDLRLDQEGILREIIRDDVNVHFSRLNRHHNDPEEQKWNWVAEYQFPRLYFDYDYQPSGRTHL